MKSGLLTIRRASGVAGSGPCHPWRGVAGRMGCGWPDGVGGVPTAQPAPMRFRASLSVTPDSVDSYGQGEMQK